MSELKHNFIQGRMNKDLDERVVPNGEYRDATNIQISTSEGAAVGTIQNILGNSLVASEEGFYPSEARTLGSIANVKNNSVYFFLQDKFNVPNTNDNSTWINNGGTVYRDMIVEYKQPQLLPSTLTPIFVDTHAVTTILHPAAVYQGLWADNTYTTPLPTNATDTAENHTPAIKPGMMVGHAVSGLSMEWRVVVETQISQEFLLATAGAAAVVQFTVDIPFTNPIGGDKLFFVADKVLFPFDSGDGLNAKHITGINIIDNLLFWTDNVGEPKKINIDDCRDGTRFETGLPAFPTCLSHKEQRLYKNTAPQFPENEFIAEYLRLAVKEQHITVIKKSPKTAPTLQLFSQRDTPPTSNCGYGGGSPGDYSAVVKIAMESNTLDSSILNINGYANQDNYNFTSYSVGDTLYLELPFNLDLDADLELSSWEQSFNAGENPVVVLKEYSSNYTQPQVPITDYRIKGFIVGWDDPNNSGNDLNLFYSSPGIPCRVAIKITSIDGFPPTADPDTQTRHYVIDSFLESKKLFEFKFPRFAYRWKYKDGEYSTYSPFSDIAFLPGSFDYHPKKGYNLGMTNRLHSVNIHDFFSNGDTPDDVVEIDLLYKDEQSTNIYVIKTIKLSDEIYAKGVGINHWSWNSFTLSSETIQSVVPSNQLLRPWDNVPKVALAQEVVGNRIVYGNYTQNFDLIDSVTNLPTFDLTGHDFIVESGQNVYSSLGVKSIKSLREYQLGVVFGDEYDRQTPVISSVASTLKLDKSYSWLSNNFSIQFQQSYPVNMDRFKFFIKETSDEYYNMAMDRFYDAQDGNIWLAFASSDRNKIDIDTFLVLKKGLDDGIQVTENARYKVLAINNEAPDFIKTTKLLICEETHSLVTNDIFGGTMSDAPGFGDSTFKVNYDIFHSTSGADLNNLRLGDKLYVEFAMVGDSEVSDRYEIVETTNDWDGTAGNIAGSKYSFRIKNSFAADVSFITNDPTGLNSTAIQDGAQFRIYRYRVENRPQFDGRFFVKILFDEVFSKYIKKVYEDIGIEYKVVSSQRLYKLPKNFNDDVWTSGSPGVGFDYAGSSHNTLATRKSEFKSWFQDFKFKEGSPLDNFIEAGGPMGWNNHSYLVINDGCETAMGWTMYNHCFDSGAGFIKHPNFTEFNSTKPPAYWFIDEGTFRGGRWNNDMYSEFGYISPSSDVHSFSSDTAVDKFGRGIQTSANEWQLDLGFGGILSHEWSWGPDPDKTLSDSFNEFPSEAVKGSANGVGAYDNIPEFFNIGRTGGNTKHTDQSETVKHLVPGSRFRFAEDPQKTVYTLKSGVDESQRIRYRRNDEEQPHWDVQEGEGWAAGTMSTSAYGLNWISEAACFDDKEGRSEKINTDFTNPANFTKNFELSIEPALTWNPTENATGIITGGLNLEITTPNVTNGTCLNCSGASDPNDYLLVLDSILAADAIGDTVQLTTGLVLWEYTDNTTGLAGAPPQQMLIKEILYDSSTDKYHVALTGSTELHSQANNFVPKKNTTLHFGQPVMNGFSPIFIENYHYNTNFEDKLLLDAVGYTIEFLEPIDDIEIMPENPAVWETEPKDNTALDIYYEASGFLPTQVNPDNFRDLIRSNHPYDPANRTLFASSLNDEQLTLIEVRNSSFPNYIEVKVDHTGTEMVCVDPSGSCVDVSGNIIQALSIGDDLIIPGHGVDIHIPITGFSGFTSVLGYVFGEYISVDRDLFATANFKLSWHNCYSFGNGVESNRIRDNFNLPYIKNGVKVSSTIAGQYKEERRKHGLIYSGIYNSTAGVNSLNQFIQAEKITKDINPVYGSIQKLHTRDSDLVTLCEDKVLKILANKDALYNADGNPQLTATDNVLGQAIPFVGEYGISKNPESFASESYRVYFADRVRGSIMRLSRDGLTAISNHGMRDWFRDRMKISSVPDALGIYNSSIIGSYDERQEEYNVTFGAKWGHRGYMPSNSIGPPHEHGENPHMNEQQHGRPVTVSFKESSKGWVSFKSFVPEAGISANGDYFTLFSGKIYKHYVPIIDNTTGKTINYNTFYGEDNFFESSFEVLINGVPGAIKSFKTLNYEGSQSKSILNIEDDQYHNLKSKKGWYVKSIFTNKEKGSLKEFVEKEGKWFNYITGEAIKTTDLGHLVSGFDASAFAIQGLGMTKWISIGSIIGCTANGSNTNGLGQVNDLFLDGVPAYNYDPDAVVNNNGSCIATIFGCIDLGASNYLPSANTDDGSCIINGCMDSTATNYDAFANMDDGSCAYTTYGCTDTAAYNYDSSANIDNGNCYPYIYGCMDTLAVNYNLGFQFAGNTLTDVNTACCTLCDGTDDNNCCIATAFGCMDSLACNYDNLANTDDGSCNYCNISASYIDNYDAAATCDDGCEYCKKPINTSTYGHTTQLYIGINWDVPVYPTSILPLSATVNTFEIEWREQGTTTWNSTTVNATGSGLSDSHTITSGLVMNATFELRIRSICANSVSAWVTHSVDTATQALGCTDNNGSNMPGSTSPNGTGIGYGYGFTWGACNYNPSATIDDGSCEYTSCVGCTNYLYAEYLSTWTQPASTTAPTLGYCDVLNVTGCTDATAFNYDASANVNNGSCCYVAGCMDSCANNYDSDACYSALCTYGELNDGNFTSINSAADNTIPQDFGLTYNTATPGIDMNSNGIIDVSTWNQIFSMWYQGEQTTSSAWHKFYTAPGLDDNNQSYNVHTNLNSITWRQTGPVSVPNDIGKRKLLFEPGALSCGTGAGGGGMVAGTGVYQLFTAQPDNEYNVTMVYDNDQQDAAYPRPDGYFQFMVCDRAYDHSQYSSHPWGAWPGQGCFVFSNPGGDYEWELLINGNFNDLLDANNNPVQGQANFMPDGITWSVNDEAVCPSADGSNLGPCTSTGSSFLVDYDLNATSKSRYATMTFTMPDSIVYTDWAVPKDLVLYVGYVGESLFYDWNSDRVYTTSRDYFASSASGNNNSCKAVEVSTLEITDVTNGPCDPSGCGGGGGGGCGCGGGTGGA